MPNQVIPPSPGSPGEELDTGTGGFPVDGKRNVYDVGSTVGDEAKPDWSPGGVNVDQTQRDLSKGTKRTLASYLSKTSMGQTPSSPSPIPNKYPIDQNPLEDPVTVSLKDERGYPSSPTGVSNTSKFVIDSMISSRSEAAANLKMVRGRQFSYGGSTVDGNTLLKNATTRTSDTVVNPSALGGKLPPLQTTEIDDTSPIKNYYGNPNVSNSVIFNRFNPEGKEYQTQSAAISSQQFASKYSLGTSQAARDMSFGRLARVGGILSTRASDELNSMEPGYIPTGASEILPGVAQLGVKKIERDELTAKSVINDLTIDSLTDDSLTDIGGKSWGTLNNINDQFSGLGALGMQLLAVALLIALSISITVLAGIFSVGSPIDETTPRGSDNKLRLGSSAGFKTTRNEGGIIGTIGAFLLGTWQSVGIEPTSNPVSSCIATGAMTFFGMSANGTVDTMVLNATLDGLDAVSKSPGYYSVLGRVIGRSFLQLIEVVSPLASSLDAGLLVGASRILNIIGSLRGSRFIRILNSFSVIGDLFIKNSKRENNKLDLILNDSAIKSRLTGTGYGVSPLTIGWMSYRAPDLLIIPQGLSDVANSVAANRMGIHKTGAEPLTIPRGPGGLDKGISEVSPRYFSKSAVSNRIPTETREAMEKALESEYVPFYMHDVRTNEIISFHAFLASLTDDYSAQYDTSEGFGRVEPIKIYKSTTRKIGFSFYVAALSTNDFDFMWAKINKLTTMIYPQFSEGRIVESNDKKNIIYSPFSQTIQASPLVRVRIGDLITSNYSKFNLARIFGYTYPETKFGGEELTDVEGVGTTPEDLDKVMDQYKVKAGTTFTTEDSLQDYVPESSSLGTVPGGNTSRPATNIKLEKGLVLEVVKEDSDNLKVICKVKIAEAADEDLTPRQIRGLKKKYANEKEHASHIVDNGYYYVISKGNLKPTRSTDDKVSEESNGKYSKEVRDFMRDGDDPKTGNIISKSFRSSGGKGLAGFIDSMSFDWYDRATWDIDPGRKAPKMCKVTISFSPIHDITPGLDHMGANRAPIYRVGS